MAKKIYAVKVGLIPGIYHTWEECSSQVAGYSGAEYKSFKNESEAEEYLGISKQKDPFEKEDPFAEKPIPVNMDNNHVDIYTDGSFQNNKYSYAYVVVKNGEVIHSASGIGTNEEAAKMQNVAGELSAIMHAICWIKNNNLTCTIYHDYIGAALYINGEWTPRKIHTKKYKAFVDKNIALIKGFVHVYGHSGNKFNELADKLAGQAFSF